MAKVKSSSTSTYISKPINRPGIHSKSKSSKLKSSKNYVKAYKGQGK
jgi:hypothetical protein